VQETNIKILANFFVLAVVFHGEVNRLDSNWNISSLKPKQSDNVEDIFHQFLF